MQTSQTQFQNSPGIHYQCGHQPFFPPTRGINPHSNGCNGIFEKFKAISPRGEGEIKAASGQTEDRSRWQSWHAARAAREAVKRRRDAGELL